MPLPCSKTPAEPARPRLWRPCRRRPRPTQTEGLSGYIISRLTQGFSIRCLRFTSAVAAAHARLPAGGLRLYREGVEPSGSLRKVSGYIALLLSRISPDARVVYAKHPFAGPDAVLAYLARY